MMLFNLTVGIHQDQIKKYVWYMVSKVALII